jgi:hypothetical protein
MMNHLHALNIVSVIVATIVYFMLGAVWYSPLLFSKSWASMQQIDMNDKSRLPLMMSLTFVLNFVIAIAMSILIAVTHIETLAGGAKLGFLVGSGFIAATLGMNYLYANRPFKLFLIDSGYHLVGTILIGSLLAVWH